MQYRIEHENRTRMRIRLCAGRLTDEQEQILRFAFSSIKGVTKVDVFPATAGVVFSWDKDSEGCRERITERLDHFRFSNVELLARDLEEHPQISIDEVHQRKLDPVLKRKMREKILIETAFDIVAPMPLQVGYHIYQLITLRGL